MRSVLADIVVERGVRLGEAQQRFARGALGIDDAVALELDVEVFEPVEFIRLVEGDGRAVHQIAGRHENAVDEQRVRGRQEEVGVRDIVVECGARNAYRPRLHRPGALPVGVLEALARDPLDGAVATEPRRQEVADGKVLDIAIASGRQDPGAAQEALSRSTPVPVPMPVPVSVVGERHLRLHREGEQRPGGDADRLD